MNKEEIEDLAVLTVRAITKLDSKTFEDMCDVVADILSTKVKLIVVGLSDEQVHDLFNTWFKSKDFNSSEVYKEWAKTQTFTLPEVKEVVVGLTKGHIEDLSMLLSDYGFSSELARDFLESWQSKQSFSFPEVKEVTVGLSDEQLGDLAHKVRLHHSPSLFIGDYKEWAKTQTFVQPCCCGIDFKSEYGSLHDDFISVCAERDELREMLEAQQQLTPNWDDAPEWATSWDLQSRWYQDGRYITCRILKEEQRPRPAAPKVEVGQVWKYVKSGKLYLILALGDMKGEEDEAVCFPYWVDSVTYQCKESNKVYTRPMVGFLAKFERVGGE